VTIGDLTKLLTTGPDEPPVCAVPGPDAAYGDRSATLVTVRIDPGRKQIDLAPGSPAEGLRGKPPLPALSGGSGRRGAQLVCPARAATVLVPRRSAL
jgi:hypothetical protein